ncbi:aquaglyceroporin like protein [Aureobasidium pullulans]|nr:aquaglyceroporin like protein [Aureobasidium pullulans]THX75672.1 aquaglyceroporin like protein [Aureobasidium pullulans]
MSDVKHSDVFSDKLSDLEISHIEHNRADSDDTVASQPKFVEQGVPLNRSPTAAALDKTDPKFLWPRIRLSLQDAFSEFIGTFIILMFGDGVVAQVVLSRGKNGDYQSISWGWGIGVMLGVYAGGKSGAHLNPAVTFSSCVFRKFPWKKFPIYMLAQVLGAFCASGVVYANYKSAIDTYEGGAGIRTVGGENSTAGIFCTYPAEFMTRTGMFFSEFIASALLMCKLSSYNIKNVFNDSNLGSGNLTPLGLFFIIFGIGACWGWETGYAINLARDFGPRLMSYFLGYGHGVWSAGGYYFWIPMVSPFFGCVFGGFLYDLLMFTGESPINEEWMGIPGAYNRLMSFGKSKKEKTESSIV